MIREFDFLTLEECKQVHDKIFALKSSWVNRAFGVEPFYTLGAVSYVDSPGIDDKFYLKKAETTNPILRKNFPVIYERLPKLLSEILQMPVSFEKKLGLPGFHIFQYSKLFEEPIAALHFDLQFQSHHWDHYKEVDFKNPISFTCPITLPHAGGGLNWWDIDRNDLPEMDDIALRHFAATKEKNYFPYTVGKLVVHKGMLLHQIAPGKDLTPQDERITLQGHGLIADGELHIYW